MIIFDIINGIFKCWSRFEFWYFNSSVCTKRIKIHVEGWSNFINKELWCNIDWYLIDHFSSLWESRYFRVESNQFFLNILWSLILLFCEIHQFFLLLFKFLIRFIKLGLEFCLKVIFRWWSFISKSKQLVLNVLWWELFWFHLLFYLDLYQFLFWLFKTLMRWRNLVLGFFLKVIFRRWIFRVDSKQFIFNVFWLEHVWFHFFLTFNSIYSSSEYCFDRIFQTNISPSNQSFK